MRRLLHRLVKRLLMLLYDDAGRIGYYAGELAELTEIDFFNNGEILGAIQITPDEEIGYQIEFFSKEEIEVQDG